jgi:hypothetical protein
VTREQLADEFNAALADVNHDIGRRVAAAGEPGESNPGVTWRYRIEGDGLAGISAALGQRPAVKAKIEARLREHADDNRRRMMAVMVAACGAGYGCLLADWEQNAGRRPGPWDHPEGRRLFEEAVVGFRDEDHYGCVAEINAAAGGRCVYGIDFSAIMYAMMVQPALLPALAGLSHQGTADLGNPPAACDARVNVAASCDPSTPVAGS